MWTEDVSRLMKHDEAYTSLTRAGGRAAFIHSPLVWPFAGVNRWGRDLPAGVICRLVNGRRHAWSLVSEGGGWVTVMWVRGARRGQPWKALRGTCVGKVVTAHRNLAHRAEYEYEVAGFWGINCL